MRPDIYTKAVLTVIAIMLTVIASKPLIDPATTANAQAVLFSGTQFAANTNQSGFQLYDSRTGEFWIYSYADKRVFKLAQAGKITKLGQPTIQLSIDGYK